MRHALKVLGLKYLQPFLGFGRHGAREFVEPKKQELHLLNNNTVSLCEIYHGCHYSTFSAQCLYATCRTLGKAAHNSASDLKGTTFCIDPADQTLTF